MKQLEAKSLVLLRHRLKALRLPRSGPSARRSLAGPPRTTSITSPTCSRSQSSSCSSASKAAERRLKAARFPAVKSLESSTSPRAPR